MPRLPFRSFAVAAALAVVPAHAAWIDDFATLDTDRWLIQLYTFPANGCNMRAENVVVRDSVLRILVTPAADTTDRKYDGGDMGDGQYRRYGLFRTRMRASNLAGSVSAFYIMNKWVATNWEHKEIDIELLGQAPTMAQLTTHDFQNGGTDWKHDSRTIDLGFDFSADFHEYAILWRPDSVVWFADGRRLHATAQYVPQEGLETRMNFYVGNPQESGVVAWLGPIDTAGIPDSTEYDWVRYDPLDSMPTPYSAWATTAVRRRGLPLREATNVQWRDAVGRRIGTKSGSAAVMGPDGAEPRVRR